MLATARPKPIRSAESPSRSWARMGITLKSPPVRATAAMKLVRHTSTKPTRPARSRIWATKGRAARRRAGRDPAGAQIARLRDEKNASAAARVPATA